MEGTLVDDIINSDSLSHCVLIPLYMSTQLADMKKAVSITTKADEAGAKAGDVAVIAAEGYGSYFGDLAVFSLGNPVIMVRGLSGRR